MQLQSNLHERSPLHNNHFFAPADSPYIGSCLNLSTTATATKVGPQLPK